MRSLCNVLSLLLVISGVQVAEGACAFPANYHGDWLTFFMPDGKQYMSAYSSNGFKEGFTTLKIDMNCHDLYEANGHIYYTSRTLTSCFGTQMMRNGNGILAQKQSADADKLNDAKNCPALTEKENAQALIKNPFAGSTCPFANGVYQVTYSTNAGDVKCDGDAASTADVSGNTIALNSCYAGTAEYKKPMHLNLTCIDDISGNSLDSDANGDILILANLNNLPDQRHSTFYCARYKIEENTIKLSLFVADSTSAKCPRGNTFTSADIRNVAFVLTKKAATSKPTKQPPVTDSIVPSTEKSATTIATELEKTAKPTNAEIKPTTASSPKRDEPSIPKTPCSFPESMVKPEKWWTNTLRSTEFYKTYTNYKIEFVLKTATYHSPLVTMTCGDHTSVDGSIYYTQINENNPNSAACLQDAVIAEPGLIFNKKVDLPQKGNTTAEDCMNTVLSNDHTYSVFVKMPVKTTLAGIDCPFQKGTYTLTYSEKKGKENQCSGDVSSTATVDGSTIKLSACDGSDSYDKPYTSTLRCVANIPAVSLHEDETNGNVMLLEYGQDTGRYYCARYKAESGKVYLSLGMFDETVGIICRTNVNYGHFGDATDDRFRAFTLSTNVPSTVKPTKDVTVTSTAVFTTRHPVTTTVQSTASNEPTTEATTKTIPTTMKTSTTTTPTRTTTTPTTTTTTTPTPTPTPTITTTTSTTTTTPAPSTTTTTATTSTTTTTPPPPPTTTTTTTTAKPITTTTTTPAPTSSVSSASTVDAQTTEQADYPTHVEFAFVDDFKEAVGKDPNVFTENLRRQLAQALGISEDRIRDLVVSPGSIIVNFDLLPPANSTEDNNEVVLAKLRKLIEDGAIHFKPLTVEPSWFKTWQGDRLCPDKPCANGGECLVIRWSLKCDCSGDYTGDYCEAERHIMQPATVKIMVILLCVVGGIIFLLVVIALVICRVRRRSEPYNNMVDDDSETPFPFAQKATAYNSKNFTSSNGNH